MPSISKLIYRLLHPEPKLTITLQYKHNEYRWPYPKYWSVRRGAVFIGIVKQESATSGYEAYADAVGQIGEELPTLYQAVELLRSDYVAATAHGA